MNDKRLLKFAVETGESMLRNGAETSRVEDTIDRILRTSNCTISEAFVTPTGIFVTLDNDTIDTLTVIKRVRKREINLGKVAKANNISRNFCDQKLTLEAAMYQIQQLDAEPSYDHYLRVSAYALVAAFFTFVFGGSLPDFNIALIAGLCIGLLDISLQKIKISKFFLDIIGGVIAAFVPYLFYYVFHYGDHFDIMVISSIMPLVPGVAITNAIRDTLFGDFISGIARATDAFIVAASIATGAGIVLWILL